MLKLFWASSLRATCECPKRAAYDSMTIGLPYSRSQISELLSSVRVTFGGSKCTAYIYDSCPAMLSLYV